MNILITNGLLSYKCKLIVNMYFPKIQLFAKSLKSKNRNAGCKCCLY